MLATVDPAVAGVVAYVDAVRDKMRAEIDGDRFRIDLSSATGSIGTLDGTTRQFPGEHALREAIGAVRGRLVAEVGALGASEGGSK